MTASRILLVLSVLSVTGLAACAGPGTYPVSGLTASSADPVMDMDMPGVSMDTLSR